MNKWSERGKQFSKCCFHPHHVPTGNALHVGVVTTQVHLQYIEHLELDWWRCNLNEPEFEAFPIMLPSRSLYLPWLLKKRWFENMFSFDIPSSCATGSIILRNPPDIRYTGTPFFWRSFTSSLQQKNSRVSHTCTLYWRKMPNGNSLMVIANYTFYVPCMSKLHL